MGRRRRRSGAEPADPPQMFPVGSFYSPVVDAERLLQEPDRGRVWPDAPADPVGIDFRAEAQLALLRDLGTWPLPASAWPGPAYLSDNGQFPPQDAHLLYAMVRWLRPARVVEIGCGWSTTVTARAILDGGLATELTTIDPYPTELVAGLDGVVVREERVEQSPLELFTALGPGDVCFIDSSHVVKTGSDVVHELLEIVPRLADGVVVHVHDVFLPADYPPAWVEMGFGWNEQYLLHALLLGNRGLHVLAMNHWLSLRHPDAVQAAWGPIPLEGSSAWLRVGAPPG